MKLSNETFRQHFVSQTEQRLNAYAGEKIYEFSVVRDLGGARLSEPTPRSIAKNLKLDDLFSFDIEPGAKLRENFETLFQKYENSLCVLTRSVLNKAAVQAQGVAGELVELFSAKLMNFARNPYSVQKMLNTFSPVKGMEPVDPSLKGLYDKVLAGRNPAQKHICQELGISDVMYREWLACLFMLLVEFREGEPNFLNQAIQGMFGSTDKAQTALICSYSSERVLLSDRAMTSDFQESCSNFDFNLCGSAFVRFQFLDKAIALKHLAPPEELQRYLKFERELGPKLNVCFLQDDLDLLRTYNAGVIEQSFERVFCSSKDVMY